jgi:hypothetical protein
MTAQKSRLRVVILGAGVSASCGIPVAKDILRESMGRMAEANPHSAREVHALLDYLYPDFKKEYRNYPNIEDFLNLLEMALTFNSEEFIESTLWPKSRLASTKEAVLSAVTDYIWGFFTSPQPSWRHVETFVGKHIPLGDVIITFNWDLTVERALSRRQPNAPVSYQYSRDTHHENITLLKPHGSINWFEREAVAKAGGPTGAKDLDPKLQLVEFPVLLFSRDLIKATPIIIPPVSNKEFSEYRVFQETWTSVYRALSSATVLTILGYSLPREDQFSRFVFRRALRNNILRVERGEKDRVEVVIVNPDDAVEGTFARLVGRESTKFHFHRAYFQDFVDSLSR